MNVIEEDAAISVGRAEKCQAISPLARPDREANFETPSSPAVQVNIFRLSTSITMPPRISPQRLSQPSSCQCFRTRPSPPAAETNTRQFHCSPNHAARTRSSNTKLRNDMFAWLNGPGKVFKNPLPNSTNYLSAYDRQGNLLRLKRQEQQQLEEGKQEELDEDEETLQTRDLESGMDEAEVMKRANERAKKKADKLDLESRDGIPKERQSDLRPYPLNFNFVSQAVLSEELREKIYELVVVDEIDLKSVSAAFGVDIRRVAAVARLKTIEKQWVQEVSHHQSLSHSTCEGSYMMIAISKYSISLEDTYMVTNDSFASLSDG